MVSIRFLAILIFDILLVLFLPISASLVKFEFIDLSTAYVTRDVIADVLFTSVVYKLYLVALFGRFPSSLLVD